MRSSIFFGVGALGTVSLAWAMGMGCGGSSTEIGGDGGLDSTSGGDSPTSKEGGGGRDVNGGDGGGQDVKNNPDGASDGGGSETGPSEASTGGETGSSTVDCPTAPCGTGLGCCAQLTGDAGFKCKASCTDTIDCLKPSDCSGATPICCATAVVDDPTGTFPTCVETGTKSVTTVCSSAAACPSDLSESCMATDVLRACSSPTDCKEAGYTACCGVPVDGTTVNACLPEIASAFLKCM
jgi:hypothetical protein